MIDVGELFRMPSVMMKALREGENERRRVYVEEERTRASVQLRQSQKLATVGRLAASIAHEINNPLASIMNLLYLLEQEKVSVRGRGFLTIAQKELDRAVQITQQTLKFYRDTPAPVAVHPQALLDEILGLYAGKLSLGKIKVIKEYESDQTVNVFPGELRQVFANLIGNAIDAASPGGRLRVRVRSVVKTDDHGVRGIRITISDNGKGIPVAMRSRVGEPFFTTKGESGTGLGLWVSRGIIQKYGGVLQLHSSVGEFHGTTFTVFVPTNMKPSEVGLNPETVLKSPQTFAASPQVIRQATDRSEFDSAEFGRSEFDSSEFAGSNGSLCRVNE